MARSNIDPSRRALQLIAEGDWNGAHRAVQDDDSPEAAWVHAHLHRVEGGLSNADYWYRRAGRPTATGPLDEERQAIARAIQGTAEPGA